MRRAAFALLLLSAPPAACSKSDEAANQAAKRRIWGREEPPPELEARAKEPIDATLLDGDPKARARVLEMKFDEVVARLGFVEYHGLARIEISRGRQSFKVVEDSVIRHGLHGSFQVVQRDGDGNPLREGLFNNGVFYLANAGGKMRIEGMVKDRHLKMREESWEPLRVFTAYYGPRLALKEAGTAEVEHRPGVKYTFGLADGPEIVPDPGGDSPKKPVKIEGSLVVDRDTGVPLKATLTGKLEVPASGDAESGQLEISLDFTLRNIEGAEIKPKKFVPTIARHPTDLEPLAFLDGGTRTSTIIGGPKAAGAPGKTPAATSTRAPAKPAP
ncbi:MAG: hypothetical protein IT384_19410 [Deltaproteobacteria bacterium]|nr:hypothetical protein [Deltaproteobacteria bacterium]